MSDVDTGTDPCPTVAQRLSDGFGLAKSQSASASTRQWWCVADDRNIFLLVDGGTTAATSVNVVPTSSYPHVLQFSQIDSYLAGDAYPIYVNGNSASAYNTTNSCYVGLTYTGSAAPSSTSYSYLMRGYHNNSTLGSVSAAKMKKGRYNNGSTLSAGFGSQCPNPITGKVHFAPVVITEADNIGNSIARGKLPVMYGLDHSISNSLFITNGNAGLQWFETLAGEGDFAGTDFVVLPIYNAGATSVAVFNLGTRL